MLNYTCSCILGLLNNGELISKNSLMNDLNLKSGSIDYYIRKLNDEGYKVDKIHKNKAIYYALNEDGHYKTSELMPERKTK